MGLGHVFRVASDWLAAGFCSKGRKTPEPQHQRPLPFRSSSLPILPPLRRALPAQSASFFCRLFVFDLLSAFTMFRAAVVRSLRATAPRAIRVPVSRQLRSSPAVRPSQFVPCFQCQSIRRYSAPAGLSKEEVEGRIVNLLKNFDKVRGRCCVWLSLLGLLRLTELINFVQISDPSKVCLL